MRKMKINIILFISQVAFAASAAVNASYPNITAEDSTISSILIKPVVDVKPGTLKLKGIESKVKFNYYVGSSKKANLVLIFSGIGGDGKGDLSHFLATEAQKRGYTSLILSLIHISEPTRPY